MCVIVCFSSDSLRLIFLLLMVSGGVIWNMLFMLGNCMMFMLSLRFMYLCVIFVLSLFVGFLVW